jgi:hypothetical protein
MALRNDPAARLVTFIFMMFSAFAIHRRRSNLTDLQQDMDEVFALQERMSIASSACSSMFHRNSRCGKQCVTKENPPRKVTRASRMAEATTEIDEKQNDLVPK